MNKQRVKFATAVLLALLVLVAGFALIRATTWLITFFQQGANPASALNITPNIPTDLGVELVWLPDAPNPGRVPNDTERALLAEAYQRAWLEWNLAYARGDTTGLATSFSGEALVGLRTSIDQLVQQQQHVIQVDTAHMLRLSFFSADGMLAAFEDEQSTEARIVYDSSRKPLYAQQVTATYRVILVQEDGFWRVRSITRTQIVPQFINAPIAVREPLLGMVDAIGTHLVLDGQPYSINGMNYYPQATPWDRFWSEYRPGVIDQDFVRMRSLQINTVRIFVPYQQFGGMHVEPEMLNRLEDLLDRAELNDLKVIVTLFDLHSDYNPLLWPQMDRHLETILTRFRNHKAILAWDLKNEPDLDYTSQGREVIDLWLSHALRQARHYAPHQLITIGWASAQAAADYSAPLDLVSFHDYLPVESLSTRYTTLRSVHPSMPIILGEYGLPTWNSPFFPNGHTEAEQAQYYADVLRFVRSADLAGAVAWTLYDFNSIPPSIAGRWPWQTGPQAQLGVLRRDGSPKAAAALLAPTASLDVQRLPFWARFLKPFWLFWAVVVIGSGGVAWYWHRFRRLPKAVARMFSPRNTSAKK